MDKNAIKKYAVWARRELIERVSQKALQYGITADGKAAPSADSVNGRLLSDAEKKQRQALIRKVNEQGYEQVMEEVAYTWFNRFAALRFMEVNGYLPSHVRVFTNDEGAFKPQILSEAIHLDLDGLDMDKVYELKNANKEEELFKYLLIVQCNALHQILPGMFQKIADDTGLLLPDYLLREGSVIQRMIEQIPEQDWLDQVQIIGWLYQYYNTEPKDKVFADLKKNNKITKEKIPAATQLFTPDWIVRYMVENSLGRLWVEGHPDTKERFLPSKEERETYASGDRENPEGKWHYYLEEAPQEPEVQKQLDEIRKEYSALTPEEILCIDPCAGSGHILCYQFDVLFQIYQSCGYTAREAVANIIEKNLWGLDIDDRAAQLAYFAVMMKARQYDRRFLSRKNDDGKPDIPQPHVYPIAESNGISKDVLDYFCAERPELTTAMETIVAELHDAKEYGSILTVTPQDWGMLYARLEEVEQDISLNKNEVLEQIKPLVEVAQALAQKYHAVVTNPPYMGSSNMSGKLAEHVKKHYPDSKSDLFAVFMERCGEFTKKDGFQAMITQHSWMFLSSFEKLRAKLQLVDTVNMAHLGTRAFEEIGGEVVQTTSFVLRKSHIEDYQGVYCRLIEPTTQDGKEEMFLSGTKCYTAKQSNFSKIPGSPVAYWVGEKFLEIYQYPLLYEYSLSDGQNKTGNNEKFVRYFWEVVNTDIGRERKWLFYAKGGSFRKWYGNLLSIVDWSEPARKFYKKDRISRIIPEYLWYKKGITWGLITSNIPSFRVLPEDATFDVGGSSIFFNELNNYNYYLGILNSKIFLEVSRISNPTLNFQVKDIRSFPIIFSKNQDVCKIVDSNTKLSQTDWDSFEPSWDFQHHPLVVNSRQWAVDSDGNSNHSSLITNRYEAWKAECEIRFQTLKANEEELNRIFIDIYGLQDELTPEVEDKDVTVRCVFDTKESIPESMRGSSYALTKRDVIVSLISYAVGCMFGRYSLDVPGLAYAGGEWDDTKYTTFKPDKDAIIPICDDEYFDDDIVGRFVKFIEVAYGKETLEENLKFIADALGGIGTTREGIRKYFRNDFYADHLKTYQKRPIYWLFDSGKKNGFKCLIYMHRYQPDTIARIRTDYVHEQQSRYRTAIADLEQRISGASTSERVKLNKRLSTLQAQATEIRGYEEKIHHLADQMIKIDLDDGVKHNYEIFKDVLAKMK